MKEFMTSKAFMAIVASALVFIMTLIGFKSSTLNYSVQADDEILGI